MPARDLIERVRKALGDRYTVLAAVGRGGNAALFAAKDSSGAPVAIKVLHPEPAGSGARGHPSAVPGLGEGPRPRAGVGGGPRGEHGPGPAPGSPRGGRPHAPLPPRRGPVRVPRGPPAVLFTQCSGRARHASAPRSA